MFGKKVKFIHASRDTATGLFQLANSISNGDIKAEHAVVMLSDGSLWSFDNTAPQNSELAILRAHKLCHNGAVYFAGRG